MLALPLAPEQVLDLRRARRKLGPVAPAAVRRVRRRDLLEVARVPEGLGDLDLARRGLEREGRGERHGGGRRVGRGQAGRRWLSGRTERQLASLAARPRRRRPETVPGAPFSDWPPRPRRRMQALRAGRHARLQAQTLTSSRETSASSAPERSPSPALSRSSRRAGAEAGSPLLAQACRWSLSRKSAGRIWRTPSRYNAERQAGPR